MALKDDVQQQIDRNVSWADDAINNANSFLNYLNDVVRYRSISYATPVTFNEISFSIDQIADTFTETLTIDDIPSLNATYTPGAIYQPNIITVPVLEAVPPVVTMPTPPDANMPATPPMPPVLENIVIPDTPATTLPPAPTIQDIIIPEPPSITLPVFDGALPDLQLTPPDVRFEYNEVPYSSELLTKLAAFLSRKLDGGTGLAPDVEAQIWDRARSREGVVSDAAITKMIESMAALGFDAPPGAVERRIAEAQREAELKASSLSRDIAIKQAELEQENDKVFASLAQQFESMLIAHSDNVANRALDVEKARVEFAISIFNTHVARYNAEIARYQAQAQVFSELVQAALANAQIYRTQVEAAKLNVDIQQAYIELYLAQLKGIDSIVGIYRTEMEAANVRMEIERNKVEAFRAQISAYQSLVQSKVAEFEMYTAQVNGEKAKVDVYSEQVKAFTAEVEAQKVAANIEESKVRASVEAERANIESYKATVDGYMATLRATEAAIRGKIGKYEADIKAFDAGIRAKIANADAQAKDADIKLRQEIAKIEFSMQDAIETTKRFIKEAEIDVQAAEYGANVYGNIAQAAAQGATSIIQIGAQEITQA